SKGVGVYFVTQDPCDLPDEVLGQLGNRIQHALRAFTPKHQKMVKAAAQTFRTNPDVDIETAITELATGEALVSCLDEHGSPGIVERAFILPPQSQMGTIDDTTRKDIISSSLIYGKYDKMVDNESAYEVLQAKGRQAAKVEEQKSAKWQSSVKTSQKRTSNKKSILEKAFGSAATSIGRELGRSLIRGILGSLKK
ncbi:MAG TPA: DUF853 family protein, partial [Acetivibrio sp.]|nr:DUF853 family protein [Acetivibrio sp.]